jgi:hypothetical protein
MEKPEGEKERELVFGGMKGVQGRRIVEGSYIEADSFESNMGLLTYIAGKQV